MKISDPKSQSNLFHLRERGCFNFRWPVVEYSLERQRGGEDEPGTCSLFSYIQDGVLYQVMRLMAGRPAVLSGSAIQDENADPDITIEAGGKFHFGCRCRGLRPGTNPYVVEHNASGYIRTLRHPCIPQVLEMQFFEDGKAISLAPQRDPARENGTHSDEDSEGEKIGDMSFSTNISISAAKATIVVATLRFRSPETPQTVLGYPDSVKVFDYVGCGLDNKDSSKANLYATDWLWKEKLDTDAPTTDASSAEFNSYFTEICLVGRCLEKILYVNYLPVPTDTEGDHVQSYAPLNSLATDARVDIQTIL